MAGVCVLCEEQDCSHVPPPPPGIERVPGLQAVPPPDVPDADAPESPRRARRRGGDRMRRPETRPRGGEDR